MKFDEAVDRFDRLWRQGHGPELQEFLSETGIGPEQRGELLPELVAIDLEYRWRSAGSGTSADTATVIGPNAAAADTGAGGFVRPPVLEDYLHRWPELRQGADVPVDLIAEEYRVRQRWGDRPGEEVYFHRFGDRRDLRDALQAVRQEIAVDEGESEQSISTLPPVFYEETRTVETDDTAGPAPRQFGRYRLLKSLGKGGMGQVFLAEDTQLERPVALKMPHIEQGQLVVERFINEARSAATLRHPGICPVFDAGEIDGQPFLTMAFIQGQTLREQWQQEQSTSLTQILRVFIEIGQAMQAAHDAGIVHRDLKSSNVMIDENGRAVVMDFGLAFRTTLAQDERITRTGDLLGTPGYMSPEQVEGRVSEIGPATDIYSLGVMLFEALTGRLPFAGNVSAILIQIARDNPTPPSNWNHDVDPELDQLCLQMLSKAPADRPQSMREVSQRLVAIQQRLATAAATTDPSAVAASSPRTPLDNRRLWLTLAALGTMVALGAALFRIQTPYGTVTVEVAAEAADDVKVRVLKNGTVVEVADVTSGWSVKLKEGEYEFDLGQSEASFAISPQSVRLSRGETEIVKVTIAANAAVETAPNKDELKPKPLLDALVGTYSVEWTESTGNRGRVNYAFREDRSVYKAGRLIGTLQSRDSQLIIDFTEPERGLVELRNITENGFEGNHTWASGKSAIWRAVRLSSNLDGQMDEKDFALSFDGQDDYVEIPTLTYDGSHPLTIEAWVTTYSLPSYAGIIGNNARSGEPGGIFLMINSLMGERFWHVSINGASAKGQNAYIWPSDERFEKVKVGDRTHIAGVWDGQRLTLFINGWRNGNMVSSEARGPVDKMDLIPSAAPFLLGASVPGQQHFHGAIDEVRFSKTVRYERDFTPPERFNSDEQTLALYHFEDGNGNILKDKSGHGHDGQIHGALWVPGRVKSTRSEQNAASVNTARDNAPALVFDGINDFVDIPYAPVDGRPPLTIEAWVQPEADMDRWGENRTGYIVSTAGFQTGLGLTLASPHEVMGATIRSPDNRNIGEAVVRPELGKWSHVAAVWTEETLRFYWNGRLKKEWPLDFNQIPGWSSWRLGRRSDHLPIGFRGAMREVRISSAERYKDHFKPQWRFESDEQTLALYHFEEGTGDVLTDSSGRGRYGRHGRIVGATWTPSEAEGLPEENQALFFDGQDDHVITPLVYDDSHPITLEAWVAASDPWENGAIITNNTVHANGFMIEQYVHNHNPNWMGRVFDGDPSRPLAVLYHRPDVEPKTHLAMVWDGEELRLYVNGKTRGSTIRPLKKMPRSRERIRLGTRLQGGVLASGHWFRFHGFVDEVRISKVARYRADFEPTNRFEPDEETWALYHCDEAGDVLKDASGNGNDAQIYGATRKPASEMDSPGEYYRQLAEWVRQTGREMPERSGPALAFTTANSYVEVPAVDLDFTKPFTLEAWATPDGDFTPNSPDFRSLAQLGLLELKIAPSSNSWQFHTWDGRGIAAGPWDTDTVHWNRRTHVVAQWDGERMKLFINGVACPGDMMTYGSIDDLQALIHAQLATANGSTILIGSFDRETGAFGGTIDRFRLSRGARYDEPFDPSDFESDDSTIVMFDFHEGEGDVLHDLSRNGYDGTIVGANWRGGKSGQ